VTGRAPDSLKAALAAGDCVRPLSSPARRAIWIAPAAVAVMAIVLAWWGLRADHTAVGPWRLWLASLLQVALAVMLSRFTLAESIPGQHPSLRSHVVVAFAAVLFVVLLTEATFAVSRTFVPAAWAPRFFWICFTRPIVLGLPVLLLIGVMLRHGLLSRPALAGALAGLAAGLASDAAWRLYCHVSDPTHVLAAHVGAILSLSATGMLAGYFLRNGSTS
jgi:hypothetical protein